MPDSPGFIIDDPKTAISPLRPSWLGAIDLNQIGSGYSVDMILSGLISISQPLAVEPVLDFSGYIAPSFSNDFYGHILVEPVSMDFESLVTTQSKSINLFNGYFTSKTLNSITLGEFDSGMSFSGDTVPAIYLPLEERIHEVTVTPDGPPTIAAQVSYDWDGTSDDISVSISGSRIVLLPVTFRVGTGETLEWGTNVLNSRNGTEQRVRTRNKPRQKIKIEAFLNNEDRIRIENIMYDRMGVIWALPMWIEAREGDAITSGSSVLAVSTLYGDFRVGGLVLVWESPRKFESYLIDSLIDTAITIIGSVTQNFDKPVIMPIRKAIAMGNPRRNTTGYNGSFSGSFQITDNIRLSTSPSTEQFDGEDVYLEQPTTSKSAGITDIYNTKIDLIDFSTGLFSQQSPWDNVRINRQFELVLDGLESIWNFRLWLHRRAGMLVPFYMPTYENNMVIETVGNIPDNFLVRDDDYSGNNEDRNHIAFYLKNETWIFRTITGSVLIGNQTQITIDSALNIDALEIDFVSYMGLKRLSTDNFKIKWLGNNVAIVNVSITEVKP